MDFDQLLIQLPVVGAYFGKAYAFWRAHIAAANVTHVILGAGLALLLFSRRRALGLALIVVAAIVHLIAFLK